MENASKALIIAGAILLSILIISLGIMIFNQASGVVDSTAMDEVAVSSFNQKFTQYEGDIKGSKVNTLLQAIIASNSNEENSERQIKVDVKNSEIVMEAVTGTEGPKGITTRAKTSTTYNVKRVYSNGLVSSIEISK